MPRASCPVRCCHQRRLFSLSLSLFQPVVCIFSSFFLFLHTPTNGTSSDLGFIFSSLFSFFLSFFQSLETARERERTVASRIFYGFSVFPFFCFADALNHDEREMEKCCPIQQGVCVYVCVHFTSQSVLENCWAVFLFPPFQDKTWQLKHPPIQSSA